jgi:hypothetical protein
VSEPTAPELTVILRDGAPPWPIPADPDLRAIDLAAPAGARAEPFAPEPLEPEFIGDDERERLALAGQDALDACLRRFGPADREAFWRAIGRCYNRPYNPPEPLDAVPSPHVIEAVPTGQAAALQAAALQAAALQAAAL